MLNFTDESQLQKRGISKDRMEEQLQSFRQGFPFLKIQSAAEPGKGIVLIQETEKTGLLKIWDDYLKSTATILKFVPA